MVEGSSKVLLRALALTDIVDSTRITEALGDVRAAEAFARHDNSQLTTASFTDIELTGLAVDAPTPE